MKIRVGRSRGKSRVGRRERMRGEKVRRRSRKKLRISRSRYRMHLILEPSLKQHPTKYTK